MSEKFPFAGGPTESRVIGVYDNIGNNVVAFGLGKDSDKSPLSMDTDPDTIIRDYDPQTGVTVRGSTYRVETTASRWKVPAEVWRIGGHIAAKEVFEK